MSIFFKKKLVVNLNFENKKIQVKIPPFKPVKYIKTIARLVYKIPNNLKINLLYNDSDLVYYNDEIIGYFFRKNPVSIKVISKNSILNEENKDLHCFYQDPNLIKYYCRDCNMFICEDCKLNNLHSSHKLIQINKDNLINCVRLYGFTLQSEIFSYKKSIIEKYGNEINEKISFKNLMDENNEIDKMLNEIHKKFIVVENEMYIYQFENYFTLLFNKDCLINKEKNKINSILKSKYKEIEKIKQLEKKEENINVEEKKENNLKIEFTNLNDNIIDGSNEQMEENKKKENIENDNEINMNQNEEKKKEIIDVENFDNDN